MLKSGTAEIEFVEGGGGGLKSFSWQTQLLSWVVIEFGLWKFQGTGNNSPMWLAYTHNSGDSNWGL